MVGKKIILVASIAVLLIGSITLYNKATDFVMKSPTAAKFDYIQENSNSACFGMAAVMDMPDDMMITGACCGPMSMHRYEEQVKSVKEKYSNVDKVPKDPYDISVDLAKDLIIDFKTITLSSEQQKVYDDAKEMSMEGGPCCCGDDDLSSNTCWRWKVYGGLAKYVIKHHNFNAEQVAEMWDISDGCGGDEHAGVHDNN